MASRTASRLFLQVVSLQRDLTVLELNSSWKRVVTPLYMDK